MRKEFEISVTVIVKILSLQGTKRTWHEMSQQMPIDTLFFV